MNANGYDYERKFGQSKVRERENDPRLRRKGGDGIDCKNDPRLRRESDDGRALRAQRGSGSLRESKDERESEKLTLSGFAEGAHMPHGICAPFSLFCP